MGQTTVELRGYRILSELRDTFAARSFRARDAETLEPVLLHLFSHPPGSLDDLLELRLGVSRHAEIRSPRLVRARGLRIEGGWIVVETDFVDGEALSGILQREGRVPADRALRIVADLLEALIAARGSRIVHGAISPACVTVGPAGAALEGAGYSKLLMPAGFYGALAREVPLPPERAPARDVVAVAGLLHHMLEGREPFEGSRPEERPARILSERWPASSHPEIFDAIQPIAQADAEKLLGLVRTAAAAPAVPSAPSLLEAVDEPPVAAKPAPRERARALARFVVRGPAGPVAPAAAAGLLVALLFGAPFLGGDQARGARRATALPSASTLPASSRSQKSDPSGPRASTLPPEPARRTTFDGEREYVGALIEIGDYRAALEALNRAKDWTEEQRSEERDALLAHARRQLDQLRQVTRALAAAGRLEEARREWEPARPFWPTPELKKEAEEAAAELEAAAKEGEDRRADRAEWGRREALARKLSDAAKRLLLEAETNVAQRVAEAEKLVAEASGSGDPGARDEADALKVCLEMEVEFRRRVQAAVQKEPHRLQLVAARFGTGVIVALDERTLTVRRGDGALEKVPVRRLTGIERHTLFGAYRSRQNARQSLGLAVLCLQWDLREQARLELAAAETAGSVPAWQLEFIRRLIGREER